MLKFKRSFSQKLEENELNIHNDQNQEIQCPNVESNEKKEKISKEKNEIINKIIFQEQKFSSHFINPNEIKSNENVPILQTQKKNDVIISSLKEKDIIENISKKEQILNRVECSIANTIEKVDLQISSDEDSISIPDIN